MSKPFHKPERQRDDSAAIARFNALFKSKADIESEAEKAQMEAERLARRARRQRASEEVLAAIAAHDFTYEELFT